MLTLILAGCESSIVNPNPADLAPAKPAAAKPALWPSDSLAKVLRSAKPSKDTPDELKIFAAQGETVSTQAVLRSGRDVNNVTAAVTGLRHKTSGCTIGAGSVQLQWVRYIDINRNSPGLPRDERIVNAPNSIPDPFWEDPDIAVKANQSQPLWLEIDIPHDAAPGDYTGKLLVTISTGKHLELPIELHVWNFEMPKERHLSIINWAFSPLKPFKQIKKNTPEYWDFITNLCKLLVRHRQTDIHEGLGLIRRKGSEEDGYTWNTDRLEKFADTVFDAGIEKIHLHTVAGKTAYILDPNSKITPHKDYYARLVALEKLMQKRNWQGRFLAAISDEPFIHHEQTYAQVAKSIHEASPSVRTVEACETEYLGELDIYVPKLSHLDLWYPQFDKLRKEGKELWFYTCCHPQGRYPNRFLDQSLLKVRVLHWINYLYDLKGYLHWGLTQYFTEDYYTQEAISKGLPLGDSAIAYPGKEGWLSSLRYTTQKNGIQDFEYLWVLENELKKIKEKLGAEASWLDPRQRPLELCKGVI